MKIEWALFGDAAGSCVVGALASSGAWSGDWSPKPCTSVFGFAGSLTS